MCRPELIHADWNRRLELYMQTRIDMCRPEPIHADWNRRLELYMQTGTVDGNCTRFRREQYKHTRTILSRLELTARSGCTGAGVDLYVGWVGLTILTN